jgi:hypothetical protein
VSSSSVIVDTPLGGAAGGMGVRAVVVAERFAAADADGG